MLRISPTTLQQQGLLSPIVPLQTVKQLLVQRVPRGEIRVRERQGLFGAHAQRFHQLPGRLVDPRQARYHLGQFEGDKGMLQDGPCRLKHQALAPLFAGHAPAQFHRWLWQRRRRQPSPQ